MRETQESRAAGFEMREGLYAPGRLRRGRWFAAVFLAAFTLAIIAIWWTQRGWVEEEFPAIPPSVVADDDAIAAQMMAVFVQAEREHARLPMRLPRTLNSSKGEVSLWGIGGVGFCNAPQLHRSITLEALASSVREAQAQGDSQVVAYVKCATGFLQHERPEFRALAAEFLGGIRAADSALRLSALLDDHVPVFRGIRFGPFSQRCDAPIEQEYATVSVSEVARMALGAITDFEFADRDAFMRFWNHGQPYTERLWYWKNHLFFARRADWSSVFKRNPRQVLRLLFVSGNRDAIAWEAGLFSGTVVCSSNDPGISECSHWALKQELEDPATIEAIEAIREYSLTPDLVDMVEHGVVWLGRRFSATAAIMPMIEGVATSNESAALRRALDAEINRSWLDPAPYWGGRVELVRLIAKLDPDRAEDLLVSEFERHPARLQFAADLIARSGMKHWELIRRNYIGSELMVGHGHPGLIRALGRLNIAERRKAAGELFAAVRLDDGIDGVDRRGQWLCLLAFADIAEDLNGGKPVVSQELREGGVEACGKGWAVVSGVQEKVFALLRDFYRETL